MGSLFFAKVLCYLDLNFSCVRPSEPNIEKAVLMVGEWSSPVKSFSQIAFPWNEYAEGCFAFLFKIIHKGLIICTEVYIVAPTHMTSKTFFACVYKKEEYKHFDLLFFLNV